MALKRKIQHKLREMIEAGAASGMCLAIGEKQECLGIFCEGSIFKSSRHRVHRHTWFDLASLTKVISTTTLMIYSLQKKMIASLDQSLQSFFPFLVSDLKDVTLRELLNHRSGLPAVPKNLEEKMPERSERLRKFLYQLDGQYSSYAVHRGSTLYSDTGFIVLGIVLEQIWGERLSVIFEKVFSHEKFDMRYGPIDMKPGLMGLIFPMDEVAPCSSLEGSELLLLGQAQDPRVEIFGGDAGHAGLFGTVEAIEAWAKELYDAYHGKSVWLSDKFVREFIDFESFQASGNDRFVNGFDTPTQPSQAGATASSFTIGHLGYTGVSCWMDMETGRRISLLCHRFSPGIDPTRLAELRPGFHDWLRQEFWSSL